MSLKKIPRNANLSPIFPAVVFCRASASRAAFLTTGVLETEAEAQSAKVVGPGEFLPYRSTANPISQR